MTTNGARTLLLIVTSYLKQELKVNDSSYSCSWSVFLASWSGPLVDHHSAEAKNQSSSVMKGLLAAEQTGWRSRDMS